MARNIRLRAAARKRVGHPKKLAPSERRKMEQVFEQQSARILHVLEDSGASVKWNDRVPDPDNPKRRRQIDVTIRRGESLTIVECRLHSEPQDVKWIEELIGRRISLRADGVIAVSASGFTDGAKKKAARFGVVLRTLSEVADDEVRSWGTRVVIDVRYVQLSGITLHVVASDSVLIPIGPLSLRTAEFTEFPIVDVLRGVAGRIEDQFPEGPVATQLFANRVFLGNLPVSELFLTARWKWYRRTLPVPVVLQYETAERKVEATVRKSVHNRTELIHAERTGSMTIDLSGMPLERCCFLKRIDIDHGEPRAMRSFVLIGLDSKAIDVCEYAVTVVRRSDNAYLQLAKGASLAAQTGPGSRPIA